MGPTLQQPPFGAAAAAAAPAAAPAAALVGSLHSVKTWAALQLASIP